jgi:hypothetical protein
MTRLERWQRAKDMGLDPPLQVCRIHKGQQGSLSLKLSLQIKEILETQQGVDEHAQCVLFGEI